MKKLLIVLISLIGAIANAQISLTIENTVYESADVNWTGVDIPRTSPTNLIFRNNTITSVNPGAYMLRCGDDLPRGNNNNLDGAIISGNKLVWIGEEVSQSTHGMMNGYSINYHTRYNYVDNASFGIVYEGVEGMTYTEGGLYYNVLKKGRATQVILNGQNNVAVYNNTFYTSRPNYSASFIKVDLLRQVTPTATSNNIKIKNNIFYSVNNVCMISIGDSALQTLECDYNVYWNENSPNHEPTFYSIDGLKFWSWDEWRAMGFDQHSVVLNPDFIDIINLVPSGRLDLGTDLGTEYEEGLAVSAVWGNGDPATEKQGQLWQVGAYVYNSDSIIIPPTSIAVSGAGGSSSISNVSGTLQLLATVSPTNATNKSVTWSIINGTGQATISSAGLVTALSSGAVTARATSVDSAEIFDEIAIAIGDQEIPLSSIAVSGAGGSSSIASVNGTLQLLATVSPTNATNKSVTWSIINGTGQATISSAGLVTALSSGTVTARATSVDSAEIFDEIVIVIGDQEIPLTNIAVSGAGGSTSIANIGSTLQLLATVSPSDATNKSVTWSIVNGTGQASISSTGLVTALSSGTIYARAEANDGSRIRGELLISLGSHIPVTGITVSGAGGSTTIDGGTLQLVTTVLPSNATNTTVTWSIINGTGQATISETGLVTGLEIGTVRARAEANDGSKFRGELLISIVNLNQVTGVTVSGAGGSSSISNVSGTLQLLATVSPTNATNKSVTWSIINGTGQATISSAGLVTALSSGAVTARATSVDSAEIFDEIVIAIGDQEIPLSSIAVSGAGGSSSIASVNGTLQLLATVSPSNATNKSVTWSILNGTGQATINSTGLVTALSSGTVTARATSIDRTEIFDEIVIVIGDQEVPITNIAVSGAGGSTSIANIGSTLQLLATVSPSDATNKSVTWSIVNGTGQASISSTGLVTALSSGTIYARAEANDGSRIRGELLISLGSHIPVTGITVSGAGGSTTIDSGTLQLLTTVLPSNATNTTVTWSIINGTGQATISETGLVTGLEIGTVRARAEANDGSKFRGELLLTITTPYVTVSDIEILGAKESDDLESFDGNIKVTAQVSPIDATNKTVTWSIINGTGKAIISSTGIVTGIDNGTVKVIAEANDGSGITANKEIAIQRHIFKILNKINYIEVILEEDHSGYHLSMYNLMGHLIQKKLIDGYTCYFEKGMVSDGVYLIVLSKSVIYNVQKIFIFR